MGEKNITMKIAKQSSKH